MPINKDYGYIYLDETARLALIESLIDLPSKPQSSIEMFGESGGQYTLTLSLKDAVCQ